MYHLRRGQETANNSKQTIDILTGGGDVPGLNPCLKQLVLRATDMGVKVIGIRRGWEGLSLITRSTKGGCDCHDCEYKICTWNVRKEKAGGL